jgi:DNA replicative helicase MCM subunit Mcm2 (Cdc46/Mcm family)
MANEGKDDYQPDSKKIEEFEREARRELERKRFRDAVKDAQEQEGREQEAELISVSTAIRRSTGRVAIPGMIIGVSTVVQMISETETRCANCGTIIAYIKHTSPLFSIPSHLTKPKKCHNCNEYAGVSTHKEVSAMIIQLQDDKNQNDLESLSVVLFDNDTIGVRNGEKVIVKGNLHVVQQKSNGKRVTFLFADANRGIQREESESQTDDFELTRDDIIELTELAKRPDYIEHVTSMFAPTVIGQPDEKLGVILMYVGAPENQDFRGRIHALFIGPPGLGKTKLAQEARELGKPYSRYTSAKGAASGKSITVIIEKENDTYTLRLGVLLQAHGSVCVINEISALPLEEQGHLYDVMEEGKKTIDSYSFHKEIEAATSVLATTNPLRGKWQNDIVSTGQIPLTLPHLDRYDLIFVFKPIKDNVEKIQYAKSKFEIFKKYHNGNDNGNGNAQQLEEPQQQQQQDYTRLRKIIKHAKSFEPELSEEAENMIIQCWAGLSNNAFPTNRIFESMVRLSMAYARLRFSNVVTLEIAKEAIEFLTKLYREFDSSVSIVHDPRDAACFEIASFLQENPNFTYDFQELINHAMKCMYLYLYLYLLLLP